MGKVSMGIIPLAVLVAMAAAIAAPAMASLAPASFGFPVMIQSGNSVAFSNDFASATDNEIMDIDFGIFDGMMAPTGESTLGTSPFGMPSMDMSDWAMPGIATPGMGHIATLFDFPGFKLL